MANNPKVNEVAERILNALAEHGFIVHADWAPSSAIVRVIAAELAKEEAGAAPVPFPECGTCKRPKKPIGRDAGIAADSFCNHECSGYYDDPKPGTEWPNEHVAQSPEAEEWIAAAARQIDQEIDDWFDGHRFALVRDGEQWRQSDDREIGGIIKRHYIASQRGKQSVEAWGLLNGDGDLWPHYGHSGMRHYIGEKQYVESVIDGEDRVVSVTITYTPEKQ